ncbi:MAG TPA: PRC-barrel domain-containing protein [Candidatus Thermoplasmatota archaeon]|nr:PRC-barrel domain-containing protein [Candidatus Thermoplasmatota archaeon]
MEEITRFVNLHVYTANGTFVGDVKNVILDVSNRKLDALLLGKTNPALVQGGVDIAVPYRWVRAFDDILLLSYFPAHVDLPPEATGEVRRGDAEAEDEEETLVAVR